MCRLKKETAMICAVLYLKKYSGEGSDGKIKNGNQYIRIAVRNREDNDILVRALQEYEGV